jgi:hypothetical protein
MRIWLFVLVGCAACSGHAPRQSGALGVFNPRALDHRLMISAEVKGNEHTGKEQKPVSSNPTN